MSALYPPESSSTWRPRPVPHPWLDDDRDVLTLHEVVMSSWLHPRHWPTREHYRDNRPIPAHLKQPGWRFGGGR